MTERPPLFFPVHAEQRAAAPAASEIQHKITCHSIRTLPYIPSDKHCHV
jgi:hypothetical protein